MWHAISVLATHTHLLKGFCVCLLSRVVLWLYCYEKYCNWYPYDLNPIHTICPTPSSIGMIGAMVRHLKSLRRMTRDHGWIHTLLEEAENERMHLLTALELRQPGPLFKMAVLGTQGKIWQRIIKYYIIICNILQLYISYNFWYITFALHLLTLWYTPQVCLWICSGSPTSWVPDSATSLWATWKRKQSKPTHTASRWAMLCCYT